MIIRDKPGFLDLAFAVRGSILPLIAPKLLFLMGFAALMVVVDRRTHVLPHVDGAAFTVFGIALSLFLGFRNNAAYDRWWEARKLWGGLLADLRALAREVAVFVPDDALRHATLRNALAFLHLHRVNLRRQSPDAAVLARAAAFVGTPHPPCAALDAMTRDIALAHAAGAIDGFGARTLTGRLASITNAQAGCERISTTPLPYVYSLLIFRTTYIYCLLLPLALIGPAGWLTPLFVGIVAYVFLGLAEVTEELSHPFGTTLNALPLDAICRAAEISIAPHMGEVAPAPLQAQNFHLG
ncbi:MAG: bestrophin family protein [Pseudomonadota bacterium]